MNKILCRPREHVIMAGRLYSQAWIEAVNMRAARGHDLPDWSDWCFLPIAGTLAIVANDAGVDVFHLHQTHPERMPDAARLAALSAWRMTQGIYRFDPAVYAAVRDTPISGDIPNDMLYRLPEWCIYIETPDMKLGNDTTHGAFVHLEHDINTGRHELRFVIDVDFEQGWFLVPAVVHLGPWSLEEALDRAIGVMSSNIASLGQDSLPGNLSEMMRPMIEPLISMTLYICSQASDIGDGKSHPKNPTPKNVKGGPRLFAAEKPTTWDVGVRLGAALRKAYAAQEFGLNQEHNSPRPHIRRAHWHGFRSGPMKRPDGSDFAASERIFELRWLPPIPVNLDNYESLPAVVRTVK